MFQKLYHCIDKMYVLFQMVQMFFSHLLVVAELAALHIVVI